MIDEHDCWKVESIPMDKADMYTRKIVWVDKQTHLSRKVEYYDKDGLLKIFQVLDCKKQDGFWTVSTSDMDNITKNHKTIMEMLSVKYNTDIKDSLFKVSTIQRGRIR